MKKTAYLQHIDECPLVLRSFFNYMSVIEEKSENSVKSYYSRISSFLTYILDTNYNNIDADNTENKMQLITIDILKDISTADILNYLFYCKNKLNLKAQSRSQHLAAIKKLFSYLLKERYIETNPTFGIQNPKKKKTLPKFLTVDEAKLLLSVVSGDFYERDYCIITLFLNCGFRLSELISLDINSIKQDGSVKITGKGNKERVVYLNEACVNSLANYLEKRLKIDKLTDKEALFVSEKTGRRIGQRRVEQIVTENLNKAGLEGYSAHKLRHTAATLMYQNGTDVRALQQLLGHSSLSTTQIYTHVIPEQVKNAVNNNPLSTFSCEKTS